jgi:hypothetical protein
MEDITARIAHLTQELKSLQAQMQWTSFCTASPGDQDRILNHLLNAGLGHNLKRAVDLLSQFLWCYIESAAARTDATEAEYAQQSQRLGQATEMLRLLHHSACPLMESLPLIEHATMTVTRHAQAPALRSTLGMKMA